MSNFKSGSGNLDFGGDDEEDEPDSEGSDTGAESPADSESSPSADRSSADANGSSEESTVEQNSSEESANPPESADEYPYFVRRNNVGDERDTRLELHVRDKVADREAEFRSELAEQLGTSEIAKTDAREFALLAAFRHPERVAELMEDEGFGALD
jgi:hypothetical protein